MGPGNRRFRQAMFYEIVMYILDMPYKIAIIPDLVFPVASLPDSLFSPLQLRPRLLHFEVIMTASGKMTLDLPPPHRKIIIIFRQCPNTVQMIGQQNKGINDKRVLADNSLKRFFHQRDVRVMAQNLLPLVRDNRKKERCPSCP